MNYNTNVTDLFGGGESLNIVGKNGVSYKGKIFQKNHLSFDLDRNDIICITKSKKSENSLWKHSLLSISKAGLNKQVSDFKEISQGSHFILFQIGNTWSSINEIENLRLSPDWD